MEPNIRSDIILFQELKKARNIVFIVLLIILLIIPLQSPIYHRNLYYSIVVFLYIPFTIYGMLRRDKMEKKFYDKWKRRREKGPIINMIMEGFKSIFHMTLVVFSIQFVVNGYTPSFIISELPKNLGRGLIIFVLILSVIIGIISWYENEKRYRFIKEYGFYEY